MEKDKMTSEQYFLRYAFPCIYTKLQNGEITKETVNKIEDIVFNDKEVSREFLETVFKDAILLMERLAKRTNKNLWDKELIADYFLREHNWLIDSGLFKHKNQAQRDLCKVYVGEVIQFVDAGTEELALVKYNKSRDPMAVRKLLIPDLKLGDRVSIHYSYAIEKL